MIAAVLCAAFTLWQPTLAQTNGSASLNYDNADLRVFVDNVATRTGRSFIIDPRLAGKVTIISPPGSSLNADEVWEVFLATMQVHGYTVIPVTESDYKIIPSELATKQPGTSLSTASPSDIVTRIVRLNFIDARSARTYLEGIAGDRSQIVAVAETNNLILVDTKANVERLLKAIGTVDQDMTVMEAVRLENASAAEVAAVLRDMVSQGVGEGARVNAVSVVAVEASNTVLLRGNEKSIQRLLPVVRSLDQAGTSEVDLSVIYLNHADAEEIVPLLTEMIDKSYSGEGVTRRPSIVHHKETNALIINADTETQRTIASVVRQLDIRRPQVLLEAIIVEVSDNAARDIGLQYALGGENAGFATQSFSNTQPDLLAGVGAAFFQNGTQGSTTVTTTAPDGTVTTTTTDGEPLPGADQLIEAAVGSLLGLNGFSIGGGTVQDGNLFAAILTAIESDTDSNVLSTPFAVTLDNQTALLSVGQEIPVTVGETVGTELSNTFRQVERKEVGIILEVTPQISEGNTIRMNIRQEVSSINGALSNLNSEFVTNKASVSTAAIAEDGEILVLGGLIDDNVQNTTNKVPVLGDLPVAGALFRGTSRSQRKSTLMVFIRPTIMRDRATAEAATARKYDYMRQQKLKRANGKEPDLNQLFLDRVGAIPSGTY